MLPCQPEYGRKEIRKVAIGQSDIVVSWAWVKVEEKERVLQVVALDDRRFGSSEVGTESALTVVGHLERIRYRRGGNDGAQELENMPWQVW